MQTGLGAGLGMQIGQQAAANAGPWGARPQGAAPTHAAPPPPPPPPVEKVWHIAKDGQSSGPFSKAAMGRKAGEGALKRDSFVWTPGQDGWQKAEDVAELAQLFTVLPPPPPGA